MSVDDSYVNSRSVAMACEIDPVVIPLNDNNNKADGPTMIIRNYTLSLNGVTVELSSFGASIVRFTIPSTSNEQQQHESPIENKSNDEDVLLSKHDGTNTANTTTAPPMTTMATEDDIVLGYKSIQEQYVSKNPYFFNVTVGRVANRIAGGKMYLNNTTYELECNNPPNHLHGGSNGIWNQNWSQSCTIDNLLEEDYMQQKVSSTATPKIPAIRFMLRWKDGDQGYPGTIQIMATFSLRSTPITNAVQLFLQYDAELIPTSTTNSNVSTPINLARHSYFNLSGHASDGILNHKLRLNCSKYTPMDPMTSIPTRLVENVVDCTDDDDSTTSEISKTMDFKSSYRLLQTAIYEYGVNVCGLSKDESKLNITNRLQSSKSVATYHPTINSVDDDALNVPYGFDHNYIIDDNDANPSNDNNNELKLVGVLKNDMYNRRLTVRTDAPGVQVYTSNYLNGESSSSSSCDDNNNKQLLPAYGQWEGICLETQHFPDSIGVDTILHPEFAKGKCVILTSDQPTYRHTIEYTIEYEATTTTNDNNNHPIFTGSDTQGNTYESSNEMWMIQGVDQDDWYDRAATYYEENCAETIDGVLGGFAPISDIDIAGSIRFLQELQVIRPSFLRWSLSSGATTNSRIACECGAGIGRVTKHLLLGRSDLMNITKCHLIESSDRLLSAAPEYIGDPLASKCSYICSGLQNWEPKANTYTIIWIQWVLIYLTDTDIIKFLQRCGDALVEDDDGLIIIKENTCTDEDFHVDCDDASVTRSSKYWKFLFDQAGLRVVYESMQTNFPDELFPVPIIALEKKKKKTHKNEK